MDDEYSQGLPPCYEPFPNSNGTYSFTEESAEEARIRQEEKDKEKGLAGVVADVVSGFLFGMHFS